MTLDASLIRQLENPNLTPDQRAELRCEAARELEDRGEYEAAREAIGEMWDRSGLDELEHSTAADVLLRVGVLTGWLGNAKDAQEAAKNLISESISIFESLSYAKKISEAQTELAYCYWREGAYDEARVILSGALEQIKTGGELKAKATLRSAIVEWSSLRYTDALCILLNAARLLEKIHNHTIKGGYHNALASVLEDLGTFEKRGDYTDRAFVEYAAASFHFEQAGHKRYLANVENNLGFLYFKVVKFQDAHEHLDRARRILINLKDSGTVAQVDETRARVFIAQKRYAEAERVAKAAVSTLEKGGRQSLLAQALTTYGIALARIGYHEQSRFNLFRAVETAHLSGAINDAGMAALAVVEELNEHLTAEETKIAFQRAYYWLATSQHSQTLQRLLHAANRVLSADLKTQKNVSETDAVAEGTLKEVMRQYEGKIIRQALQRSEGSVTQAARLLGLSYQSLAYTLRHRYKDLLPARTPIKRRKRSIIKRKD